MTPLCNTYPPLFFFESRWEKLSLLIARQTTTFTCLGKYTLCQSSTSADDNCTRNFGHPHHSNKSSQRRSLLSLYFSFSGVDLVFQILKIYRESEYTHQKCENDIWYRYHGGKMSIYFVYTVALLPFFLHLRDFNTAKMFKEFDKFDASRRLLTPQINLSSQRLLCLSGKLLNSKRRGKAVPADVIRSETLWGDQSTIQGCPR